MATLTLRDVPEELHDWLKQRAQTHHRSVNKEIIALLEALRDQPAGTWSAEDKYARLMEISRRGAARPVIDSRSEDEILGYDRDGLPG